MIDHLLCIEVHRPCGTIIQHVMLKDLTDKTSSCTASCKAVRWSTNAAGSASAVIVFSQAYWDKNPSMQYDVTSVACRIPAFGTVTSSESAHVSPFERMVGNPPFRQYLRRTLVITSSC